MLWRCNRVVLLVSDWFWWLRRVTSQYLRVPKITNKPPWQIHLYTNLQVLTSQTQIGKSNNQICIVFKTKSRDRNTFLAEKGLPLPKATSTGTTIVGCLFKDGIVLGADTRATEGPIVADKNCEKVRSCDLPISIFTYDHCNIDPLHNR